MALPLTVIASTLFSTTGSPDDSDYWFAKAKLRTPGLKTMDLWQRRNGKKGGLQLKLGSVEPPIHEQRGAPVLCFLVWLSAILTERSTVNGRV